MDVVTLNSDVSVGIVTGARAFRDPDARLVLVAVRNGQATGRNWQDLAVSIPFYLSSHPAAVVDRLRRRGVIEPQ